ncbi:ORF63 [Duck adenovirus 2]|uniref:ORF63 n=1 Tax=Duck adenovirus 2 TaxID=1520006 RepID=A0A075FA68_9ADEN|nr:ORF63 [Duck adenovirus 2]AIE77239.1 ORF63 [Duck adenovirus 2]UIY90561.1 ORF63 [Duck adenovirus 2]
MTSMQMNGRVRGVAIEIQYGGPGSGIGRGNILTNGAFCRGSDGSRYSRAGALLFGFFGFSVELCSLRFPDRECSTGSGAAPYIHLLWVVY